ncbi:Ribonuclease H-like superfamily protein [Rhynchospora pubera]|uniref:Ribonuclease H-like superfamily protein n=1 Tax=Rhynchospora pubera TaxID=906938 RepID=A0AAV8BUZ8_9POAL|nr:Ribonuclease H-like superfamily protein [Rhynchospora pubera]
MHGQDVQWKYIWRWKNINPKIKVFMWRLLSGGLPLAYDMHRKIQSISPMCARCHQENEYSTHCFFFCQGSRMVWFIGNLGLRVDNLPLNICEAVHIVTQTMSADNIRIFCNTLWEIWLERNEVVFQHKNFDPMAICKKVQTLLNHNEDEKGENQQEHCLQEVIPHEYTLNEWQILIDASWDKSQRTGTAVLIYHGGVLKKILMQTHNSPDPFYAESLALKEAVCRRYLSR